MDFVLLFLQRVIVCFSIYFGYIIIVQIVRSRDHIHIPLLIPYITCGTHNEGRLHLLSTSPRTHTVLLVDTIPDCPFDISFTLSLLASDNLFVSYFMHTLR